MTLGGRSVDFWMSSTSSYSRLLITTDTAKGLPQTRTDHENPVMIRRDAVNKSLHVITINGPALGPALTHAWAPHPSIADIGAQLVKALKVALPEHQFV
jgi:hypothetical protein